MQRAPKLSARRDETLGGFASSEIIGAMSLQRGRPLSQLLGGQSPTCTAPPVAKLMTTMTMIHHRMRLRLTVIFVALFVVFFYFEPNSLKSSPHTLFF